MAAHPLRRGVAITGHALVQEKKGCVEGVWHGFQYLSWDAVRAWGFSPGHAAEAAVVSMVVELSVEHGGS